ncbi:MAG: leucine-rich repeat protein, partial [Tidjanibacter sp.]|nr:leucine-rich repeat protein [Tidjanibacter sp.]
MNILNPKDKHHLWDLGVCIISNTYNSKNGIIFFDNLATSIGEGAFDTYSTLTDITIGSGIRYIESEAFMSCYNLKTINLPNTIKAIGSYAFFSCSKLQDIICL